MGRPSEQLGGGEERKGSCECVCVYVCLRVYVSKRCECVYACGYVSVHDGMWVYE